MDIAVYLDKYLGNTVRRKTTLATSLAIITLCGIIGGAATANNGNTLPELAQPLPNLVVSISQPDALPVMAFVDIDAPAEILPEWRELHERNNHLVGWMKLGDTVIDYPVVQVLEDEWEFEGYTGNTYYLKRDFDKKHDEKGSLFVDWHTPIVNKRRPDNTIIYGHNMRTGLKFNYLINYFTEPNGKDLSAAYHDNPTIDFTTVYDNERSTYKIFATMYINTMPEHGEVFNYFQRRFFNSRHDFFDYIGNVMDRSVFYTDVDIEYGDEILTLSTCFFPFGREVDSRVVVVARRVREGEESTVDTSKAYINSDPLYFDYYYRMRGGAWNGRNWDTSKVKGFDEYYSGLI